MLLEHHRLVLDPRLQLDIAETTRGKFRIREAGQEESCPLLQTLTRPLFEGLRGQQEVIFGWLPPFGSTSLGPENTIEGQNIEEVQEERQNETEILTQGGLLRFQNGGRRS